MFGLQYGGSLSWHIADMRNQREAFSARIVLQCESSLVDPKARKQIRTVRSSRGGVRYNSGLRGLHQTSPAI